MSSSYCGCSPRPTSQTPVCSAGWVCPPSPMCSRCIPEDRHAGAHLRDRDIEHSFFTHITATGLVFFKRHGSLWSKLYCDFWTHHRSYQRGTDRNKWGRIIFVGTMLLCEKERNVDRAVHTLHVGFSLYHSNSNWAHAYQFYINCKAVHSETICF